jgi:hypothetical protein
MGDEQVDVDIPRPSPDAAWLGTAVAQGMLNHADLSSPRMTQAKMMRA